MRIWTPFPWLIPQDPQPFPAPHRKPHALCITIQAYFGAGKQKIERNTELPGLPQSVPQLLMFLRKTRSRSEHTELPRGKHEIFSIVIPFLISLFSSSNFLREKKSQKKKVKDARELTVCFLPTIIWMLVSGGGWARKHRMGLEEVRIARFPLRGQDDTRRGGTWDLIYAPWKWWGEWRSGAGWYLSDQSRHAGERWWSGTLRHLACINGQTTTGVRCMHAFMTGYKCTELCLYEAAHTYTQSDLDTEYASTALRMCLWHLNGTRLLTSRLSNLQTYYFLLSKGLHTICECEEAIKIYWHSPFSVCSLSKIVKDVMVSENVISAICACVHRHAFLLYVRSLRTWLFFFLYWHV